MSTLTEDAVRFMIEKTSVPIVLRGYVNDWPLTKWNLKKWTDVFEGKQIPFRCMTKDFHSDEPCWERRCNVKLMTFDKFKNITSSSEEWMYFDYKYLHQWCKAEDELYKLMTWKSFGYADKGAADTTLWIGSDGAHTPAHQDTYGFNIVTQVYGKKRWILFPPETGGLKPTRVPYEESSVYSELNFYCPANTDVFQMLTGGRMVELSAGDALVVPQGWWHYVQNVDPVNISLNMWIPHENDKSTRISEALIKIFVAQICKDLPEDTAKLIINPNEDDLTDTPLAVLFLQLDTVAKDYLDVKRKTRRVKRQRTCEDNSVETETVTEKYDIKALLDNPANHLDVPPVITSKQLIDGLKENISRYVDVNRASTDDEVDGTTSLRLTKAVIDSFSQSNALDLVKQELLARIS